MQKILLKNQIILTASITALLFVAVSKYGISTGFYSLVLGTILMMIAFIYTYRSKKMGAEKKAIITLFFAFIISVFYNLIVGGSATAAVASYLLLAMSTSYFSGKLIKIFLFPTTVVFLILAIIMPETLEGPEAATVEGAITKVILYALTGYVIYVATQRGQNMYEDSIKLVNTVNENKTQAGRIAKKLTNSVEKLALDIKEVLDQGQSVMESTNQMRTSTNSISNAIVHVSEKISETENSTEQIYNLAQELEKSFEEVEVAVRTGNGEAKIVKESLEEITTSVDLARESTNELVEEMERISIILDKINAIAGQTNLLSLNASIEAARAGELGKGFAVVAGEIRELSSASANASQDINSIIESIRNIVKIVDHRISRGVDVAKEGSNNINHLLDSFQTIEGNTVAAQNHLKQEYGLINSVKGDVAVVNDEVETLVAISQENTEMVLHITERIENQTQAINLCSNEVKNVDGASKELTIKF
ncbi:MAG: methyl-accepting chemotaxis protein [Lachnospiraceae bacterium]